MPEQENEWFVVCHPTHNRPGRVVGYSLHTWDEAVAHVDRLNRMFPQYTYGARLVVDEAWRATLSPTQVERMFGAIEDEPYVNEDCPEQCSERHEVDRDWVTQCPATERHWRYCSVCGWDEVHRYANDPESIGGDLYCDPYEHGFHRCDDCGEWMADDECNSGGEYDDGCYCSSCIPDHRNGDVDTYLSPAALCSECNTPHVHLDEWTEDLVCDHRRDELRRAKRPVRELVAA